MELQPQPVVEPDIGAQLSDADLFVTHVALHISIS
jgi:hypothetical protein